jgi:hypothetical protein
LTHGKKISCGRIFFHLYMDEWYLWIKKYKWMKKYMNNKIGWKIKTNEHNLFTTKNYVSIQILHVHNWKVCVNQNVTYSFPKGMLPLGIETMEGYTFSIFFPPFFNLNLVFQTFYI